MGLFWESKAEKAEKEKLIKQEAEEAKSRKKVAEEIDELKKIFAKIAEIKPVWQAAKYGDWFDGGCEDDKRCRYNLSSTNSDSFRVSLKLDEFAEKAELTISDATLDITASPFIRKTYYGKPNWGSWEQYDHLKIYIRRIIGERRAESDRLRNLKKKDEDTQNNKARDKFWSV